MQRQEAPAHHIWINGLRQHEILTSDWLEIDSQWLAQLKYAKIPFNIIVSVLSMPITAICLLHFQSDSDDNISLKGLSVLKNLSDILRPFSPSILLFVTQGGKF